MFEYLDIADCDKLVAQPDTDDDRKPVVFISTTGLNNGVYVPLDRVEEVIAGIRDAARQASGQQPDSASCGSRSLPTYSGKVVRCVLHAGHTKQCQSATEYPYVSWPNPSNGVWNPAAGLSDTQPANDEARTARTQLAELIGYGPNERDDEFEKHVDALIAASLHEAARRMENAGHDDDAVAFLDLLATRQTVEEDETR